MPDIIESILNDLPKQVISDANFEGANIVLYTNNKEFFLDSERQIKAIVDKIKKRVELRADSSLLVDKEKAEKFIREAVPAEAEIIEIIFDVQRSIVVIEVKKPGLAIGKGGEILHALKKNILWTPQVQRSPAIRSKITENIRNVLYLNNNYRKRFLNQVGNRIYKEWNPEKIDEWVRLTFLGSARQVGRSCLLLTTPESKILIDCGIDVAASNQERFPILNVPELDIKEIDAIILSHAHLDHSGMISWLYKMGYLGPVYMTMPSRDIASLLALDYIGVAYKKATQPLFSSTDIKDMVKHSIAVEYNEVTDITPDVRLTFYNAGHALGCVTPDTMVVLADGSIKEISKTIGKHNPTPINALSMNDNLKIVPSKGVAFRKTYAGDLYHIKTPVGEVTTTPEHPFFTIENSRIKEKRADELNSGDYIAVPRKINVKGKTQKLIKISKSHCPTAIHIKLPSYTSQDLMQLVGYLLGDGCKILHKRKDSKKGSITIFMTDKNIKNLGIYKKMIKKIFNVSGNIKKTGAIKCELHVNCTELARFFEINFPGILVYSPKRTIPQIICKSTNEESAKFLTGLFDAEASVGKDKIEIGLTSKNIIDIIKILLLRFGILSQQSTKKQYGRGKNRVHKLVITERNSIEKFFRLIGFSDQNKEEKLKKLVEMARHPKMKSLRGIPKIHKELSYTRKRLRLARRDFDITMKHYESGKHKISYEGLKTILGRFEWRLKQLNQLKIDFDRYDLWKVKEILGNSIYKIGKLLKICPQTIYYNIRKAKNLSRESEELSCIRTILQKELVDILEDKELYQNLKFLQSLCNADIGWEKIIIEKIKNNYREVFDLCVPGNESFITNGIISHNSAMIHLNIGNGLHNLLYTADFKYGKTRLLEPAVTQFSRMETLIVESTYGSKNDVLPSRQEAEEALLDVIKRTIERKGKVLIPELGLGRSQETMLILEQAMKNNLLPQVPIFIDGMIWDITAIHTAYPNFLSANVKSQIFQDKNPFASEVFKRIGSPQERQEVVEGGPCIVLATSGMLVGGASVEYFRHFADSKKNSIVFVCYQGIGSLGRQVQEGIKEVKFNVENREEITPVNLEVVSIEGLTAHSTRNQLLAFVNNVQPKPKKIIVNHGEQSKCLDLASTLYQLHRIETNAPRNLETIRLR